MTKQRPYLPLSLPSQCWTCVVKNFREACQPTNINLREGETRNLKKLGNVIQKCVINFVHDCGLTFRFSYFRS